MKTFFENVLKQIKEFFTGLSKKEKIKLFSLIGVIIALSITVAVILGRVNYEVLYSGLSAREAGEMLSALEEMGVSAQTRGSDTILVPEGQVSELRMRLSAEGFQSGNFNYEIFQNASGFGTTDLEKQTYLQFQLQANLRDYIMKMEKIEDCLVIVNLPKESAFVLSSAQQPASASVLVEVKGGGALSKSEANAIAETVSMGIPGLLTENIRIVDSKMNLYSTGVDEELSTATGVSQQFELEEQFRSRVEEQVVNFLTPVFGANKIKAAVNVALNFDKEVVQSVVFEPPVEGEDTGIIVSMQELYESARNYVGDGGVPGTDSNGMGTVQYPYGGLDEDQVYNKVLREMNYEINESTSQIEKAQGTVKSLSIAILIDSEAIPEDYTANIQNLVANAIGVNENYISVERLPFQFEGNAYEEALAAQREFMEALERRDLIKMIITAVVILLLGLAVVYLVRSILANISERAAAEQMAMAEGPGTGIDYLADEEPYESAYKDVDLSAKSEGLQQLEKFIDKDPQAVAQLLRNWLTDDIG